MKLEFTNAKEKQEFRDFKKDLNKTLSKLVDQDFLFDLYTIEQHYLDKLFLYLMRRIKEKKLDAQIYPFGNHVDTALISRIIIKFLERTSKLRHLMDEGKKRLFSMQVRWSYISLVTKPKKFEKRKIFKLTSLESSYLYPEVIEGEK